jgi:hypothetical protein
MTGKRTSGHAKRDAATSLSAELRRIRLNTTDRSIRELAQDGQWLTAAANDELGNTAYYDSASNNNQAWSCRGRAKRKIAKARKIYHQIIETGDRSADWQVPSFEAVPLVARGSEGQPYFPALIADHEIAEICRA